MTWSSISRALPVAALLLAGGSALSLLTGHRPARLVVDLRGVDVGLHLDVLSTVLLGFVGALSWLIAVYAGRNVAGQPSTSRFVALQLGVTAGLMVLVTGASLPVMALGWTASGLALAALVAHAGTTAARRASRYVRRTLVIGDLALWAGVVVALVVLPTVDRVDLPGAVLPTGPATVVALLLLVACVTRSALVPAHRWLPETAEAPSPVSALLHAGVVNGAGVLLTLLWPLLVAAPLVLLLLLVVGTASVVVGTLVARERVDVKGRLASSTTSQMGYMAVQLGLGLPAAAVLHLVGHGWWKSWLFLRAGGAVQRARSTVGPGAAPTGPARRRAAAALAAPAVTLLLLLAAPALLHSVQVLGPAALLPALLAAAGVGVAASAAARPTVGGARPPLRTSATVAGAAAAAGAGYLWLVAGIEVVLDPSLPAAPVRSASAAVVLLLLLLATVVGLLVSLHRPGRLPVLLSGAALPPWTRHVRGTATWPRVTGAPVGAPPTPTDRLNTSAAVREASADLAPAWPLRTMVAASAMAGLEHLPVERAGEVAAELLGADGLLPAGRYDELLRDGRISVDDVAAAVRLAALDEDQPLGDAEVDWSVEGVLLTGAADGTAAWTATARTPGGARHPGLCELGDQVGPGPADRALGEDRLGRVRDDHASLWCQRAWSRTERPGPGPWQVWRAHAVQGGYDRALRLRGASALVRTLPQDPVDALTALLRSAGLTGPATVGYLRGLLAGAPGWAGHALWRARRDADPAPVVELLALRAALDALVAGSRHPLLPTPPVAGTVADGDGVGPGPDPRHLWQSAYELGYGTRLLAALEAPARTLATTRAVADAGTRNRPPVQWVACIDVRSERVRRHLEAVGDVETVGFAGFFGVDLALRGAGGGHLELCPALLRACVPCTYPADPPGLRALVRRAVAAVSAAPLTPLLVAEAGGAVAGAAAVARTLTPAWWGRTVGTPGATTDPFGGAGPVLELDLPARVALAAAALRGTGLVGGTAEVVVLCGHGASLQNNAFATAYDCGACGGNPGGLNARALAGLLEDHEVRAGLAAQGVHVPDDTWFVAGMHCTTTDELVLDPLAEVPPRHRATVARLQGWLGATTTAVRQERLPLLPGYDHGVDVAGEARRRAQDWAQPFPEWGLAGNAAIVVGPRALTRGTHLDGRVFLHSYDQELDPDASVLEQLLTAPVVVAHWISSQYRLACAAPDVLGAGDKTTHNVLGDIGVLSGAHGDLRTGLPWQALYATDPRLDPTSACHEPLRLLVVVHARTDALERVLERHGDLADLVGNGWVRLVQADPDDGSLRIRTRTGRWVDSERLGPRVGATRRAEVPLG